MRKSLVTLLAAPGCFVIGAVAIPAAAQERQVIQPPRHCRRPAIFSGHPRR